MLSIGERFASYRTFRPQTKTSPMPHEIEQECSDQRMLLSTNNTSVLQEAKALRELPADGLALKRAMDIVISGTAFLILLPVMTLITLLVKLTSPGPIFFCWNVVGKGGQPFVGYKFRTMFDGAERIREQ